jgi:hypothetical protein
MTSTEGPQDRPPAEGGDLPEAGPGADRVEEHHPLSEDDSAAGDDVNAMAPRSKQTKGSSG